MDFMAIYGEAGMIGVVGAMFVYLVISLSNKSAKQQEVLENLKVENKGQSETLENMEGMIIKLIDRHNTSDNDSDRRYENTMENADRRHEKLTQELRTQSNELFYIKGKMDASK